MFANLLLGAALVVASPTNALARFSTETEQTFPVPDITERNVWLDCRIDFTTTPFNRIEIAFGPDVNGDGQLGDDEAPFVFAVDCGRMIVRDGNGNELHSDDAFDRPFQLSFVPARRGAEIVLNRGLTTAAMYGGARTLGERRRRTVNHGSIQNLKRVNSIRIANRCSP